MGGLEDVGQSLKIDPVRAGGGIDFSRIRPREWQADLSEYKISNITSSCYGAILSRSGLVHIGSGRYISFSFRFRFRFIQLALKENQD